MIQNQIFRKQVKWNFWGPPLAFIILLIIEKESFGTFFTSLLYGLILILTGILYSVRYRLFQPVLLFSLAGLTLWHYIAASHIETIYMLARWIKIVGTEKGATNPFSMETWLINLVIFLAVGSLAFPVIRKAFLFEENAKKLFKLAAMTVTGYENGFTSRPLPGKAATFSEEQLKGFARFMHSQLISLPLFSESGVTLSFSMGKSPLAVNDPSGISYVKFDNSGGISIKISERDYKRFSRRFTFDLLCRSMESVFSRFLGYYINNEENHILKEIRQTT